MTLMRKWQTAVGVLLLLIGIISLASGLGVAVASPADWAAVLSQSRPLEPDFTHVQRLVELGFGCMFAVLALVQFFTPTRG